MSSTPIPDPSADAGSDAAPPALASSPGLTGQGADSAMAHLREREQKREGETQRPDEGTGEPPA